MSYLKFRKVPKTLELRLKIAGKNEKLESNCYGTAFFLLGILPYDIKIQTNDDNKYLRNALRLMEISNEPRNNSIIICYDKEERIHHAAFIRNIKPFKGYQREGFLGSLTKINNLSDIESYLEDLLLEKPRYKYYIISNSQILLPWSKEIVKKYTPWG